MLNNLHLLFSHLYPIFLCCILLFAASRAQFHLNLHTFITDSNVIISVIFMCVHTKCVTLNIQNTGNFTPLCHSASMSLYYVVLSVYYNLMQQAPGMLGDNQNM